MALNPLHENNCCKIQQIRTVDEELDIIQFTSPGIQYFNGRTQTLIKPYSLHLLKVFCLSIFDDCFSDRPWWCPELIFGGLVFFISKLFHWLHTPVLKHQSFITQAKLTKCNFLPNSLIPSCKPTCKTKRHWSPSDCQVWHVQVKFCCQIESQLPKPGSQFEAWTFEP